jgi:hypothetical protein
VLVRPTKFERMLLIVHPLSGEGTGRSMQCTAVRVGDSKAWLNAHPTNIWVHSAGQETNESFQDWFKGLTSATLRDDGTYVAVGPRGNGTCPFRVCEKLGDDYYRVSWRTYGKASTLNQPYPSRSYRDAYLDGDSDKLRTNNRRGQSMRATTEGVILPESFKLIEVEAPYDYDAKEERKRPEPIEFGNLLDVQTSLMEKLASLKILDLGGSEVFIRSVRGQARMSKTAALLSLIRDHGFDESSSRQMLKEAETASRTSRQASYRVKYAQGYGNLQPGPSAPEFPEPWTGTENFLQKSVPSIYSQEEFLPAQPQQSDMTDPQLFDPYAMPEQNTMAVAEQASQSGQKEVFDTAMISGLLKNVRQDTIIDRHLGDLMKAVDKLGRILFSFYWHPEEFEDRYGKSDLPELEDSLRNSFETLGDTTLFLKQKSVSGRFGGLESASPDSPSPNIEQAARS